MSKTGLSESAESPDVRAGNRFLSLLLLAEVVLVATTLPLWTSIDRFPAVPLLTFCSDVPVIVDQCLTAVLCFAAAIGAVGIWRATFPSRAALGTAVVAGGLLVLLNQHRLQPWHWLFMLICLQQLMASVEGRIWLFRLTIASMYVFAAASRCVPEIATGMSRQVLTVSMNAVGLDGLLDNNSFVRACCVGMTVVELLAGVALLIPRWRKFGVIAAVSIHTVLILALSPLGLNHHPGVVVWNTFLLVSVPILFVPDLDGKPWIREQFRSRADRILAAFVVLFPISCWFGIADNWLSWHVYSPRPEVVRIYVREDAVSELPADISPFVEAPLLLSEWCPVRIDRWCLATQSVPLYPEDRFQLAIALQLIESVNAPDSIRISMDESGKSSLKGAGSIELDRAAIRERSERFFFNGSDVRTDGWKAAIKPSLPGPSSE